MSYYLITVVVIKQDSPRQSSSVFNIIFSKNNFFPSSVIEWKKLDSSVRNWERLDIFEKRFLQFIRPSADSIYHCMSHVGLK